MTVLDQVFIKAYGKSVKTAPPEACEDASPLGHRIDDAHAALPPATSEVAEADAATVDAGPAFELFQPPDQGRIDARHGTPRPHWTLIDKPIAPIAETTVIHPAMAVLLEAPTPIAVVVQESPAAIIAPAVAIETVVIEQEPAAIQSTLRAAFEVDRFLWPDLCQRLLAAAHWSEASRELAAASRDGQQVFVIASQHRGEGRTTLALCLAQRLAEKKLRVALVDAGFHRPQLARQLKLLPGATWDEVLRGTLPLTESWIESVEDGVTLLPLKERADTTGLIGNPRLKEQFSLLRRMNDIVLIDAGSLEDFSDREVLALLGGTAQIDGALIVRDVRKTAAGELEQAPKCLDALGIARVDVVENFVNA